MAMGTGDGLLGGSQVLLAWTQQDTHSWDSSPLRGPPTGGAQPGGTMGTRGEAAPDTVWPSGGRSAPGDPLDPEGTAQTHRQAGARSVGTLWSHLCTRQGGRHRDRDTEHARHPHRLPGGPCVTFPWGPFRPCDSCHTLRFPSPSRPASFGSRRDVNRRSLLSPFGHGFPSDR